jgi:hypothetical protein
MHERDYLIHGYSASFRPPLFGRGSFFRAAIFDSALDCENIPYPPSFFAATSCCPSPRQATPLGPLPCILSFHSYSNGLQPKFVFRPNLWQKLPLASGQRLPLQTLLRPWAPLRFFYYQHSHLLRQQSPVSRHVSLKMFRVASSRTVPVSLMIRAPELAIRPSWSRVYAKLVHVTNRAQHLVACPRFRA